MVRLVNPNWRANGKSRVVSWASETGQDRFHPTESCLDEADGGARLSEALFTNSSESSFLSSGMTTISRGLAGGA